MKMQLKPTINRVIVKPIAPEEKTASGIILPAAAQEENQFAEVVRTGDGSEVPVLNVGDKVIYKKYAGTDVQLGDEKFTIVSGSDIIAVITET